MSGLPDTDLQVMRRELGRIYPWAPDEALDAATELVSGQLDRYDGQPTYTLERYERAQAIAAELATLVGRPPAGYDQESDRSHRGLTEKLRGLNPLGLLRGPGGDERRGLHR